MAVRLPSAECCASPKQLPSHMGHRKAEGWAGPLLTPFLSVWPCRIPRSLLASPSLQPLTKACCGVTRFPTKARQVEEKEGGGHCVLVSQ